MPTLILILVILVLTVISFYYGFKKPLKPGAWKTKTGALVGVFLCAFVGYALMEKTGAERELTEYIEPYPNLKKALRVAPTQGSEGGYWLFSTPDQIDDVLRFYDTPENLGEWRIKSSSPMGRILKRDNMRMEIFVAKKGESTEVIYRITP